MGMGERCGQSQHINQNTVQLNLDKTSFRLIWMDACLSLSFFSFFFIVLIIINFVHIQFHYQLSMLGQNTSKGERLGKWVQLSVVDLIFRSLLTKGLLVLPFLSKTRHDSQNQGQQLSPFPFLFPLFFFI